MPNVWESLSPPPPPPLPASNSLSADQLSLGHPHLVEARFVEMITDSRNWRRNLNNSNSSFGPQPPSYYYSTLISLSCTLPSFSEISSSFWLLRRRQHRDELSPETSVFVQLAQSSPASPYLSLSSETVSSTERKRDSPAGDEADGDDDEDGDGRSESDAHDLRNR